MKKVILTAALVLACTVGSNASAMNEAALNASKSELMPVKKTTKKSTKKSSSKKSTTKTTKKSTTKTSTKKSTSTSVDATTGATSSATAATTAATTTSIGSIISGLLNNVIGSGTFSKADLCAHTWKYSKPGCAFTSENLLAKAGGEIAANKVEEKLST